MTCSAAKMVWWICTFPAAFKRLKELHIPFQLGWEQSCRLDKLPVFFTCYLLFAIGQMESSWEKADKIKWVITHLSWQIFICHDKSWVHLRASCRAVLARAKQGGRAAATWKYFSRFLWLYHIILKSSIEYKILSTPCTILAIHTQLHYGGKIIW